MMKDYGNGRDANMDIDCSSVRDEESLKSGKSSGSKHRNNEIGTKETKDVVCLRFVVFLVLFASVVSVGVTVFLTIRKEERSKFEEAYDSEVSKVFTSITTSLKTLVGSLDMFASIVVSHARDSNSTWPFVTIPDFPIRVSKQLSSGVGVALTMSVIVQPKNRLEWEEYALNNSFIVPQALRIMETDKNFYGRTDLEYRIEPTVVELTDSFRPVPYNTTYVYCSSQFRVGLVV
jgi:hypothetical protein